MLTENQEKIYRGLKHIGEEISNFYLDSIEVSEKTCKLYSKANIIAHLAREIDGGLRDIFSPVYLKKEKEKEISGPDKGHIASILIALGRDEGDLLALEWFSIATQFHKIAHRSGPYKLTKDPEEMLLLWGRYERILLLLIGSFYVIIDRLDSLLTLDKPTNEILDALPNLLCYHQHATYFFGRLVQPGWVASLKERSYFKRDRTPLSNPADEGNQIRLPINFLLNIAKTKYALADPIIEEIIIEIQTDYVQNEIDLHPYVIDDIANLVIELDDHSFSPLDVSFFREFTLRRADNLMMAFSHVLVEGLPDKILRTNDKDAAKNFLEFVFGIHSQVGQTFEFDDLDLQSATVVKPIIDGYLHRNFTAKYCAKFTELIGLENVRIVTEKIEEIVQNNSFSFSTYDIPSIELSDQSKIMFEWPDNFIDYIVRGAETLLPIDMEELTRDFLFSKVSILQRIGFHMVRNNFSLLGNIFWNFINNSPYAFKLLN